MNLTVEKIQKAMDRMPFKSPYSPEEWLEHLYMENYHCHKDFSNAVMTDSAESIENYAKRILEYGSGKCLYSGEHGSQGNQFHVYKVAEQYGLKYRHSAEAYFVKDRHEKDRTNCHIMLVAKNPEGRKDLNYILSVANESGYYYRPRIDFELLLGVNPKNLIATSSCLAGWGYEDSDDVWLRIADHFKENFFFEIQTHNTEKQKVLNKHILELSEKHNIPIICGLDSHYVLEENRLKREYMQKDDKNMFFEGEEDNWYLDYPDTETVIKRLEEQGVLNEEQILESILNTNVFVNECEEIVLDRNFKIPNIYKDKTYEERVQLFRDKVFEKYQQDPHKSQEKIDGLNWEIEQLAESGVIDYPLVSEAIVKEAVEHQGGVITPTARGSSSSYLTNNYMGLTTIDRFNADVPLIPERFVTKDRVLSGSMPDCDNNVSNSEPFINASRKILGEYGCYPLMTLKKYKEKSAWLMYARVNNIDPQEALGLSKALDKYNKALKYADEEDRDFIKVEDYIPQEYSELYKNSLPYQGITESVGQHPCAAILLDGDVRREIGLISAKSETTGKRTLVAAVEGQHLDEFGYVKEDFLIVDAVSLTKEMFDAIGEPIPSFERLKEMVKNDPETWSIYSTGQTCCVNQCEKESTTKKAMKYKPKDIAELASFIAIIRPGGASLLNSFLHRQPYTTGEPAIDKLLEDSGHRMLYQESIMKVLSFLGLPMTDTYTTIKAISKKKLKGEKKEHLLEQLRSSWLEKFGNLDNFDKVWKVIEDAASYSFNACVSGDTRIQIGWGTRYRWNPTVEEMYKTKNDFVWAFNHDHERTHIKYNTMGYPKALSMDDDGKLSPNQIIDIQESGVRKIYRVMTTSGAYVDCTMDHKIPTVERGIQHVEDLKAGDKVYFRSKGYQVQITEIESIEYLREDMVYDVTMDHPRHNFLTESGLVVSNCHAYAMAGDSLYQAWFKAHHHKEFYEVAISHYQAKGNKNKIDALIKEAVKFYGYKIGSYEFGVDNRKVNIDEEKKILYPNLSAVKGFGEKVVQDLYEAAQGEFSDFESIYQAIDKTALNRTQTANLARLGYFNKWGNENQILALLKLYEFKSSLKKSVSKKKLEDNHIPLAYALPFGRETTASIMDLDKDGLISFLESKIDKPEPNDYQRVYWQWAVTGLADRQSKAIRPTEYFVTEVEVKKGITLIHVYSPFYDKSMVLKMFTKSFEKLPIEAGDFIGKIRIEKKVKTEATGIVLGNGKREYRPVASGETEAWLKSYSILNVVHKDIKEEKEKRKK